MMFFHSLWILSSAYAQNIEIQAFPSTVNFRENDLVIVCSITNPSQLASVFFIQLLKNSSTLFDDVVSVATGQTPPVQWKDSTLQYRASATGSLDSPSTAQLRFTIDKNRVICPSDFNVYKCRMSGLTTVVSEAVTQETTPITISYIGMHYLPNLFNNYWYLFMYLLTKCNCFHELKLLI